MAPATNMAITGTVNHDNTVNNKDIKSAVDMDFQDMVNNINNYSTVDKDIMALAINVITLMSLVFMVTSLSMASLMALLVVGTVITKDIKGDIDKDIQDMVNNITN